MRPYRTVDDKIDGVVITFVDVTEHRAVAQALGESQRQLLQEKRLVELSRNPIFVWDFDGGIEAWNRGCEELYGFSYEEAIGKRPEQLLGSIVAGSSFAGLRERLLASDSWSGEVQHRAKDGRALTVEAQLDLRTVDGRRLVLESGRDTTHRKLLQARQQLLLGELTHRVKNTLAVVQSIAHQTLKNSPSPEQFVERFGGRLSAMASSHGLLVQSEWRGADLEALARLQLEPYAGENANRVSIEGPKIVLPADLATPFGLVLHELATNAAKYGSLSRPNGKVHITWGQAVRNGENHLNVVWKEIGGPRIKQPTHQGLGSNLIDNGIPGGVARREFRAQGLVCTIELPLPEEQHHGELA
jgi:two-component system CheB/CheR fusion protein